MRDINQKLAPMGKVMPTGDEKIEKLNYLKAELTKIGLDVESIDLDISEVVKATNLYATYEGSRRTDELLGTRENKISQNMA